MFFCVLANKIALYAIKEWQQEAKRNSIPYTI